MRIEDYIYANLLLFKTNSALSIWESFRNAISGKEVNLSNLSTPYANFPNSLRIFFQFRSSRWKIPREVIIYFSQSFEVRIPLPTPHPKEGENFSSKKVIHFLLPFRRKSEILRKGSHLFVISRSGNEIVRFRGAKLHSQDPQSHFVTIT